VSLNLEIDADHFEFNPPDDVDIVGTPL